jgi:hypothetical protein
MTSDRATLKSVLEALEVCVNAAEFLEHFDEPNEDSEELISEIAIKKGKQAIAELQALIQRDDDTPCPYVVTGRDGTSHCRLAEQSIHRAETGSKA